MVLSASACAHGQASTESSGATPVATRQVNDDSLPLPASVTLPPSNPVLGATVVFTGMCDASGAVPLTASTFMVADDEDNILRVYDTEQGGAPLWLSDMSAELALPSKPGKPTREMDLEAATRIGDSALWLTSYARTSSGRLKNERFRFFATTMTSEKEELRVLGFVGTDFLDSLLADPRYSRFGLQEASKLAPKAQGGLNIEGMTARFEGGVWIGFRNPIPQGKALLVSLLNPLEMIKGATPQFGDPKLLPLGGFGVRSLSSWRGEYLIAAGHYDRDLARPSTLYRWDGQDAVSLVESTSLHAFNPEGFFTPEEREEIMFLSDDGNELIDGVECKREKDASKKQFRGVWVRL